jgi:hypothetical protein
MSGPYCGRYRFNRHGLLGFLDRDFSKSTDGLFQLVARIESANEYKVYFVLYRDRKSGQWIGTPWGKPTLSFHVLGTMKEAEEKALRYCRQQKFTPKKIKMNWLNPDDRHPQNL